eukprot:g4143.t1
MEKFPTIAGDDDEPTSLVNAESHYTEEKKRQETEVKDMKDAIASSIQLKDAANKEFKQGLYEAALQGYNDALSILPELRQSDKKFKNTPRGKLVGTVENLILILQTNRAVTLSKLARWNDAVSASTRALCIDHVNVKALYRRGVARMNLQQPDHARRDFCTILSVRPKFKAAIEMINKLDNADEGNGVQSRKNCVGKNGLLSVQNLKRKDFDLQEELGEGNFSKVYKAVHISTGKKFALKVIEKAKIERMKVRHPNIHNEILMERKVLKMFRNRHPHIISFYGTFQDDIALYYVLEYAPGGELWSRLLDHEDPKKVQVGCSLAEASFYTAQVVSALKFMARNGIVHRDLKPENMMLTENGHIKLIDFMTCKNLVDKELNGPEYVGTPEYMSPEAINGESCNCSADLWALGCFIFQLIAGYPPFKCGSDYLTMRRALALHITFPSGFDKVARDLVERLLVFDWKDRMIRVLDILNEQDVDLETLSAVEDNFEVAEKCLDAVKAHPFFGNISFSNLHVQTPPDVDAETAELQRLEENIDLEAYGFGDLTGSASRADCSFTNIVGKQENQSVEGTEKGTLTYNQRARLMHRLEIRGLLLPSLPLFYPSEVHARCIRARRRGYLGYGREGNDEFSRKFSFMYLNLGPEGFSGQNSNAKRILLNSATTRINALSPKFVVICGNLTSAAPGDESYMSEVKQLQSSFGAINEEIDLFFVSGGRDIGLGCGRKIHCNTEGSNHSGWNELEVYRWNWGDEFYGAWFGGVRFLYICSHLWSVSTSEEQSETVKLQEEQLRWLKYELYVASLCAHHIVIFSSDPLLVDGNNGLPTAVRIELLQLMKTSKVSLVLTGVQGETGGKAILTGNEGKTLHMDSLLPPTIPVNKMNQHGEDEKENDESESSADEEKECRLVANLPMEKATSIQEVQIFRSSIKVRSVPLSFV